jgi:hypothetical protein
MIFHKRTLEHRYGVLGTCKYIHVLADRSDYIL